jgi:hypothetical protein
MQDTIGTPPEASPPADYRQAIQDCETAIEAVARVLGPLTERAAVEEDALSAAVAYYELRLAAWCEICQDSPGDDLCLAHQADLYQADRFRSYLKGEQVA